MAHAVREAMETLRWTSVALARSRGLEQKMDGIELRLRIRRGASSDELADEFLRELLARLDEAQSAEDLVVPNHAYCFRCESFLCEHARPAEPRAVLAGYEPTGRPRWVDFVSFLFDRRDARAENVADRSAGIVAIVMEGSEVLAGRLEAFGGESPDVGLLCQVLAGPFPVQTEAGGDEEGAVTIQLMSVRFNGRERLVLHAIGDPRLLDPTNPSSDADFLPILARARAAFGAKNGNGSAGHAVAHKTRESIVGFARAIANDLARDLQHHYRVRAKRTRHAIERSEIGVRPTAHAFPEARAASDDAIRVDRAAGTFVLLGKNSRVHFFNGAGRHVTSVRFTGDAIRARLDTGRWRAALPSEIATFRSLLNGHGPAGGRHGGD